MSDNQDLIVIIGAGPSGLLTAHWLKENGYTKVFVLEKRGRVGGLAHSMTYDGRSFDLGANYITPAYKEIRKIARKIGATTYAERPFIAMKLPDKPGEQATLGSIVTAMRIRKDGTKIPFLQFAWANVRYIWKRFWLGSILDRPTFAGMEEHPEMSKNFIDWLDDNDLMDLYGVFLLPVNLMGYGTVETTPAMYALKFMTLKSYVPMMIKEMPVIGHFSRWPRRFTFGFQRFFERLSWNLNVRTNVKVKEITRNGEHAVIKYEQLEQVLDDERWVERTLKADHLILACPLIYHNINKFLDINDHPKEKEFLGHIQAVSYCMTSLHVTGKNFDGKDPLAACYPQPDMSTFLPWGIAKQWHDSDFVQFYTRVDPNHPYEGLQAKVEEKVAQVVKDMGGTLSPENENWRTYNRFPYFQHVNGQEIAKGWYTDLENWQGENRTYYVGGATNFELIEPIAEYSKHMVAKHFPPIS